MDLERMTTKMQRKAWLDNKSWSNTSGFSASSSSILWVLPHPGYQAWKQQDLESWHDHTSLEVSCPTDPE
jgi:hypothetical protein